MIKLYKRPFRKTFSFSTLSGLLVFIFSLFIFGRYILLPCLQCGDWASWAALGLISIFMLAVWYSYIGMYFYIILEDDTITVQNHLLPFLKISRNYKELGSIRFWLPTPGNWSVKAVEMVRKGKKRGSLYLGILMVDPNDYAEIVSTLESKGVRVETYRNLSHKEFKEVSRRIRKGE